MATDLPLPLNHSFALFIFLTVNRDITYVTNKKFGRYDLEYAR